MARPHVIFYGVSHAEIDRIEALAQAEALSRSSWVRRAVLTAVKAAEDRDPEPVR